MGREKHHKYLNICKIKFTSNLCATLMDYRYSRFFFFFFFFLFLNFTILYCFAKYRNESATGIHVFPILNPPPSPYHPSGSSQCIHIQVVYVCKHKHAHSYIYAYLYLYIVFIQMESYCDYCRLLFFCFTIYCECPCQKI